MSRNDNYNSAEQEFIGTSTSESDARLFHVWYSSDIIKYLLHSSSNNNCCLRYVFMDDTNHVEGFKVQFESLIILANLLEQPVVFISKEPGHPHHWLAGVLSQNNLLIWNPLGITHHHLFYDALCNLQQKGQLKKVVLSTTKIQRDPEGDVSCGPIAASWASYLLEQIDIIPILLKEFDREPDQEINKLQYIAWDSSQYLPQILTPLINELDTQNYVEHLLRIRAQHFELLQSRALINNHTETQNKYWQECLESAEQRLVMMLLDPKSRRDVATFIKLPLYLQLEARLSEHTNLNEMRHQVSSDRIQSSAGRASLASLSALKPPRWYSSQNVWLIDVPHDNSCLFWAAALAYLLPIQEDETIFSQRCERLFGQQEEKEVQQFQQLITIYSPHPGGNKNLFHDALACQWIQEVFRRRVVDYMATEINIERYRAYWTSTNYLENNFEDYLSRQHSPSTWAGELEIQAMSELLEINLHLLSTVNQEYKREFSTEGATFSISLAVVNSSLETVSSGNHYQLPLDPSLNSRYWLENPSMRKPRSYVSEMERPNGLNFHISHLGNKRIKNNKLNTVKNVNISSLKSIEDLPAAAEALTCGNNIIDQWQLALEETRESGSMLEEYNVAATDYYIEVLRLSTQIGQPHYEYQVLGYQGLGHVYYYRGDYISAVALYNFALGIIRDSKKSVTFRLASNIDYEADLIQDAKKVEKSFLEKFSPGSISVKASPVNLDKAHRDFLESIREGARARLVQHQILESIHQKLNLNYNASQTERGTERVQQIERIIYIQDQLEIYGISIQQIYQKINQEIRDFVKLLIEESQEELKFWKSIPDQDSYAVICFGSLARDEATPYSDLEFGVLLAEGTDTDNRKEYFRVLTQLLNIKVLNLGETTPRMQDIQELKQLGLCERYSRAPNHAGFCFDGNNLGGRKTPLGNCAYEDVDEADKYELICTPEQMADMHSEIWYRKNRHLSTVLMTAQTIIGNENLCDRYEEAMQAILNEPINEASESVCLDLESCTDDYDSNEKETQLLSETQIQMRSMEWLQESVENFQFRGGRFTKEGHFIDVKYHLYRLPNMMIDHLASYFGVREKNLWDRIGSIYGEEGIVPNREGEMNLRKTVSRILALRLSTYLERDNRHDPIILNSLLSDQNEESLAKHLGVEDEDLFKIYYTLLPLQNIIENFIELRGKEITILNNSYFSNTDYTKGEIFKLLLKFEQSKKCYESYITQVTGIDKVRGIMGLASIYRLSSKFNEAEDLYKQVLESSSSIYRTDKVNSLLALHIDAKQNLGILYCHASRYLEALMLFEEALKYYKERYGDDHLKTAEVHLNIGNAQLFLGEIKRAELKYALVKKSYSKNRPLYAKILSNIALVFERNGQYEEASQYLIDSYNLNCELFGERHYDVAKVLNNLAGIEFKLRKFSEAALHYKKAIEIKKIFFQKVNLSILTSIYSMASVLGIQGNYQDALNNLEEMESILKAMGLTGQIQYAHVLNNMGIAFQGMKNHKEAQMNLEKAFALKKRLLPPNHCEVVKEKEMIGLCKISKENLSVVIEFESEEGDKEQKPRVLDSEIYIQQKDRFEYYGFTEDAIVACKLAIWSISHSNVPGKWGLQRRLVYQCEALYHKLIREYADPAESMQNYFKFMMSYLSNLNGDFSRKEDTQVQIQNTSRLNLLHYLGVSVPGTEETGLPLGFILNCILFKSYLLEHNIQLAEVVLIGCRQIRSKLEKELDVIGGNLRILSVIDEVTSLCSSMLQSILIQGANLQTYFLSNKVEIETTTLILMLAQSSGLEFRGLFDSEYYVDAIARLPSEEAYQTACVLQAHLEGRGEFCITEEKERIYVLRRVNQVNVDSSEDSLGDLISRICRPICMSKEKNLVPLSIFVGKSSKEVFSNPKSVVKGV